MNRTDDLRDFLVENESSILQMLKRICEIPSPTFHEEEKTKHLAHRLKKLGLKEVTIDRSGNAIGKLISLPSDESCVLISAHCDTACEAPTPIEVEERNGYLFAHGIGDNSAGISAVLTFLKYLHDCNIRLKKNYLIGFTVGEEGFGAKRGMKGLVSDHAKCISYVVNVESHDIGRVTNACAGQFRAELAVTTKQKGAHSWRDFGEPSATVVLSSIIRDLSKVKLPRKTTYNVTLLRGGKGINSIPNEARCLLEFRAKEQEDLETIVQYFGEIIEDYESGRVSCTLEPLTTTEAVGLTKSHPIFAITQRVQKSLGIEPFFKLGNSDGDVSLAHGIPTVTLGASNSRATHSLDEHMEKGTYIKGIEQVIRIILALDEELWI